jgi:hypothetical protein
MSESSDTRTLWERFKAIRIVASILSIFHNLYWIGTSWAFIIATIAAAVTWLSARLNPAITYPLVAAALSFLAVLGIGREFQARLQSRSHGKHTLQYTKPQAPVRVYSDNDKRLMVDVIYEAQEIIKQEMPNFASRAKEFERLWGQRSSSLCYATSVEDGAAVLNRNVLTLGGLSNELQLKVAQTFEHHQGYESELHFIFDMETFRAVVGEFDSELGQLQVAIPIVASVARQGDNGTTNRVLEMATWNVRHMMNIRARLENWQQDASSRMFAVRKAAGLEA